NSCGVLEQPLPGGIATTPSVDTDVGARPSAPHRNGRETPLSTQLPSWNSANTVLPAGTPVRRSPNDALPSMASPVVACTIGQLGQPPLAQTRPAGIAPSGRPPRPPSPAPAGRGPTPSQPTRRHTIPPRP